MPEHDGPPWVWSPQAQADLRAAQDAADASRPGAPIVDLPAYLAELETRRLLQLNSYRLALLEIVNVLGPDGLCSCTDPCEELRTEAGAALEIAHAALRRGSLPSREAS